MLYVTTRDNRDAYTSARAIRDNRGPDGGLYAPFRLPFLSNEEIGDLAQKRFSAALADMLNLLFNARLTPWDVEFCIGRYPVRLTGINQKTMIAELWHNAGGNFGWLVDALSTRIYPNEISLHPGNWFEVGVRMAVLTGIVAELLRGGAISSDKKVDICLVSGDFSGPMSAWYVRKMGLPIGNIVCTCNENNALWDLIHHGQLRTDLIRVQTNTPDADIALPVGLERLIHAAGGPEEVCRYLDVCRRGGMYCPDDRILEKLRSGLQVSVVGQKRVASTIPSVFATSSCVLSPYASLAYCGLLDYRVRAGENRCALVISEKSPVCDAGFVSDCLGIEERDLEHFL